MKIARSALYLILVLYICYLTYLLSTDYQRAGAREHVSFVIWTVDTIDLFIHEAGHFFFGIFGRFIGILGGSLFQVLIPVSALIVFFRSNPRSLLFTLYWTGQSLVNVSIYIADAPFKRLHLISKSAIHDWNWLLNNADLIDHADEIAAAVNAAGLLICTAGILAGLYFTCTGYRTKRVENQGSDI
jgi:hypothetical protein